MHRRLAAAMATLGVAVGSRSTSTTAAATQRCASSRRCGRPTATSPGQSVAQFRQGDRHHRGPRPCARRRGDRDRRRPAGPAGGDPAIWSPPGAPATTRSTPSAAGATATRWLKKAHRRGVLPPHAQPGRSAAAAERRRLPADEPPRGRRGTAVARAPSLHEGPVRLGRISQHRRGLRPRAARRRHAPSGRSGNCGTWRSRASPASASGR